MTILLFVVVSRGFSGEQEEINRLKRKGVSESSFYFAEEQRDNWKKKKVGGPFSDLCSSSWSRNEFYLRPLYRIIFSGIK